MKLENQARKCFEKSKLLQHWLIGLSKPTYKKRKLCSWSQVKDKKSLPSVDTFQLMAKNMFSLQKILPVLVAVILDYTFILKLINSYNSSTITNPYLTAISAAWVRSLTPNFTNRSLT